LISSETPDFVTVISTDKKRRGDSKTRRMNPNYGDGGITAKVARPRFFFKVGLVLKEVRSFQGEQKSRL